MYRNGRFMFVWGDEVVQCSHMDVQFVNGTEDSCKRLFLLQALKLYSERNIFMCLLEMHHDIK